ncbi:MAG: glutathione synthase, partial [Nannocystaceae bacterium]
ALDELGGQMIVKPVFGFGGRAILKVRRDDPNLNALLELATQEHSEWTVAQEFLPAAREGDKRILLVDGEPVGAVLRVPAKGEGRSNFHVGGTAAATTLTPRELKICAEVGPFLAARGQFFVGLDVIGEMLTELNVTSPTGMQEVNRMGALSGDATMEARFWDGVERRLKAR